VEHSPDADAFVEERPEQGGGASTRAKVRGGMPRMILEFQASCAVVEAR
jgi:hypothetical protein